MGKAAKEPVGFARYSREEREKISRHAGQKCHELGRAYVFTRKTARNARIRSTDWDPVRSRKRCATCGGKQREHDANRPHRFVARYEYFVDGVGWVSRQRVYQLRRAGRL